MLNMAPDGISRVADANTVVVVTPFSCNAPRGKLQLYEDSVCLKIRGDFSMQEGHGHRCG